MLPRSPGEALGTHASGYRDLLIDVVRSRHDLSAEAHQTSGSRYAMGFGSQWRDLLDDNAESSAERGYPLHKLAPAGYVLPVVNDCLVYVWRVPGTPDAVSRFASSPTRRNGFVARPPDPGLFEPGFGGGTERQVDQEPDEIERVVRAVGDSMPLVLVLVHSSPRQLQAIEWAVADIDSHGNVRLLGQEAIWEPGLNVERAAAEVESFDSGTPAGPEIQPREEDGSQTDG